MSRSSLRLVVLAVLFASPASAQIVGRPIEVSGQLGWSAPDARAHVKSGLAGGASVGIRMLPWLVLEGQAYMAPSEADTLPEQSHDFTSLGVDFRVNIRPADERVVPYILYGLAAGKSSTTGTPPDDLTRGTPSLAIGTLINLRNQRSYLRLQIRDSFFRQRDAEEFDNDFVITAGLHWVFGGKEKDTDLDGVREWLDACQGTAIGAKVDARGCALDADRDSVPEGIDQCAGTPPGCKVDARGCPIDTDGDGVCDGVDQCADTPSGTSVDEKGCPNDVDGDGVTTPTDQCPDTPKGAVVDEKGCPKDADGDGVFDGLDQCADTPAGLKVDAQGCPTEVLEKEKELFDTGMIRLTNVSFATGKADLLPASHDVLDIVGQVFRRWPELKFEIGGHTDNRGADRENQRLSEARARSVETYLLRKYPDLKGDNFTPKGYGESKPVVPNTSDANMSRNRRIEFVVTNRDQLRRDAQKRREMQQSK